MAHKWDSIGIQLSQQELVSQLRNSPKSNEQKLQQILDVWTESQWGLVLVTRAAFSNTLKSSTVGLNDVATDFDVAVRKGIWQQLDRAEEEDLKRAEEDLKRLEEEEQQKWAEEARKKWQLAYKESLEKHGSVSVDVTQCVFTGPSAVGKSSLKHLLVHNTPKAVKTSTAVMDAPEVVAISSEQYAVEGGTSAWQLVSNDVMGNSLQACVTDQAYDEGQYPELRLNEEKQSHQPTEGAATPYPPAFRTGIRRFLHRFTKKFSRSSHAASAHQSVSDQCDGKESTGDSEIVTVLDEKHSTFMHNVGALKQGIKLENASFIHLLDTGGQPSFQDALPLLLDTPCTYIQVFNAARDLDQPVPVTYRPDDHTEEVLPSSAETGWEMMLRSFSSMQTMAHKSSKELASFQQEGSHLPQLSIFMVGTFKDQLMKEGRLKDAIRDISKHLKELEGKPYYPCIKRDTAGQPFYIIDNMADKQDEKACVNSLRKHLSTTKSSFKVKVPVVWYVCEQITQGIEQKFIRFQDLKTFCLKHKFIDANGADEQFRCLLKLFSLLGFYSFFDLKDVPDEANYVCTDKGVFLKEVSKLLAVQFRRAPRCQAVVIFKQHGIISSNVEIFEELGIIEEVDRRWFLAALEHVGLVACYASAPDHSPSYFMPIALPQGKTKLPDCCMAPLCVTFTFHSPDNPLVYTDLPRGIFCRLAVELSKGPWTPIPKKSDRNTVKFHSEAREFELYLTEAPGFISLTPVLVEELEGKEPLAELHRLCRQLYDTLHKSIAPSAKDVLGDQFSQTAEIVFGVECHCRRVPHLACPTPKGKSLICQATQDHHKIQSREQIWFIPVDSAELVEVAGCNVWVMKETGGPSSDPPLTGHLKQNVRAQGTALSQKVYAQQVLLQFRDRFIDAVVANDIMYDLKHKEIIDGGDVTTISQNNSARQNNQFLHNCLMTKCTEEALLTVCNIIITVQGNPKMQELGTDMKRELNCLLGAAPPK